MPRATRWVDTLLAAQVATGGKFENSLATNLTGIDTTGWTLARLIFCYDLSPIIPGVASGAQIVHVGIGVASAEAVAGDTFADPETDGDFPTGGWIYRCSHRVLDDTTPMHFHSYYRDLRAMRRLQRGQLFITITNSANTGTAFSMQLTGISRALYLL